MNNSTQAQKGFKTFLLTLSISLIVFSVIYFFITNNSTSSVNLDANVESNAADNSSEMASNDNQKGEVAGAVVGPTIPAEEMRGPMLPESFKNTDVEKPTIFGQIAAAKPTVQPRAVLAATTAASESSSGYLAAQSAVPNGGSFSITVGLFLSLLAFAIGLVVIYRDPRKSAILAFERDAVKNIK